MQIYPAVESVQLRIKSHGLLLSPYSGVGVLGSYHHTNRHDKGGGLKQYQIAQADPEGFRGSLTLR